jgi:hypothetical protein
MEVKPEETTLIIIALGKTYPVKEELSRLGFQWNQVNKVWYRIGELTDLHCDLLADIAERDVKLGIFYRSFELSDRGWSEIH